MKQLKKLCSVLLAILLAFGTGALALAAEAPTLRIVSVTGYPTESVDVAVEIVNNPGIIAALIQIAYDPAALTLTAVQDGGLLGTGTMVPGGDKTANPYTVLWSDSLATANHTQDGILVIFTFTVKKDAPIGDTAITLTCKDNSCFDCDLNLVSFQTQSGTVTIAHDYVPVVTPPTCTEKGYTTYTCTICGDSYVADETDATGHRYSAVVTPPTCTKNGYTTYTCSACGDRYTDDETQAVGHKYSATVTPPTCISIGYTTYICSVCRHSYTADIQEQLPHTYTSVVTPPTCTEKGYTTYTCSVCGDTYTGDETEMIPHTYTSVVTPPTCTEKGYTTYTCSVCGYGYTGDETELLPHTYTSVVTQPTCTE